MTAFDRAVCACGWRRPFIAITTLDNSMPPPELVPCYLCPDCGSWYISSEIPPEEAARINASLERMHPGEVPKVYAPGDDEDRGTIALNYAARLMQLCRDETPDPGVAIVALAESLGWISVGCQYEGTTPGEVRSKVLELVTRCIDNAIAAGVASGTPGRC